MNPEDTNGSIDSSFDQANDYQQLMTGREAEHDAFLDRLDPTLETEQFKAEMAEPDYVEDENTGIRYAVYRVNRDKEGTPLVVNLAWSAAAGVEPGRSDIKAYASHLDRPVIVIDMEATGKTSVPDRQWRKEVTFDDIAAGHLGVVDKLGVDKFDIVGYSMGGIVGAKMAALAGERVESLITISTVGFEDMKMRDLAIGFAHTERKSQKQYIANAPEAIAEETKGGFSGTIKGVPTLLRLASMMKEAVLQGVPQELSTNTKWTDIVGSKEAVTDWRDHMHLVRQRNADVPHSSSVLILADETHSWGTYKNSVAEAAAITLNKSTNPS